MQNCKLFLINSAFCIVFLGYSPILIETITKLSNHGDFSMFTISRTGSWMFTHFHILHSCFSASLPFLLHFHLKTSQFFPSCNCFSTSPLYHTYHTPRNYLLISLPFLWSDGPSFPPCLRFLNKFCSNFSPLNLVFPPPLPEHNPFFHKCYTCYSTLKLYSDLYCCSNIHTV